MHSSSLLFVGLFIGVCFGLALLANGLDWARVPRGVKSPDPCFRPNCHTRQHVVWHGDAKEPLCGNEGCLCRITTAAELAAMRKATPAASASSAR